MGSSGKGSLALGKCGMRFGNLRASIHWEAGHRDEAREGERGCHESGEGSGKEAGGSPRHAQVTSPSFKSDSFCMIV